MPSLIMPVSDQKGWKWFFTVAMLDSTAFLYALDTTIAADVQPAIMSTFPGSIEELAWVGAGLPLGGMALILPLGVAYGMFNIKVLSYDVDGVGQF